MHIFIYTPLTTGLELRFSLITCIANFNYTNPNPQYSHSSPPCQRRRNSPTALQNTTGWYKNAVLCSYSCLGLLNPLSCPYDTLLYFPSSKPPHAASGPLFPHSAPFVPRIPLPELVRRECYRLTVCSWDLSALGLGGCVVLWSRWFVWRVVLVFSLVFCCLFCLHPLFSAREAWIVSLYCFFFLGFI